MERREDRVIELENQIAELKRANAKLMAQVEDFRSKEQTISSAIISSMEHANQLEASRKKLYSLDIQRSRLMYLRMEQIINELYNKYPELKKDMRLKDMSEKFKSMLFNDLNEKNKDIQIMPKKPVEVDPIKKLLHNIIDCFDTKKVQPEQKPVVPITPAYIPSGESGFDFQEALNPTMGLDEILKAFNLDKKEEDK